MKEKINNITNNFYSDEWYTDKEIVNLIIEEFKKLNIDLKNKYIMCPFDTEKSEFVIEAKKITENVIYNIKDFLDKEGQVYQILYTNPPFSIKDEVIEKCLKDKKPSALILPMDSLGGVKRHKLYQKYGYPYVIIPNRRIHYTDKNGIKKKGSSMHSIIMFLNCGQSGIKYMDIY